MSPASKRPLQQSTLLAAFGTSKRSKKTRIFCDLDGVLVDFDGGVTKLLGKGPQEVSPGRLWSSIAQKPGFYRDLDWTADGEELWEAIRPLQPAILSGVPRFAAAADDKIAWCRRELCVEVIGIKKAASKGRHEGPSVHGTRATPVITCWSKNKHLESRPGHILIDDRRDLQPAWEKAGGTFIWHSSTASTLRQLRDQGILEDDEENKEKTPE